MSNNFEKNMRSAHEFTAATVTAEIGEARKSFTLSKDSAAKAAAHVYMVWLATLGEDANSQMKEWLGKAVMAANQTIGTFNAEQDKLKVRAEQHKDGKLSKDDAAVVPVKTKAEREQQAKIVAELEAVAAMSTKAFKARKKVTIEMAGNDEDFVGFVRFVLDLTLASETSSVSRYATVVRWVHNHFKDEAPVDADQIVVAIKAAGGFEVAIDAQREAEDEGGGGDDEAAEDLKVRREVLVGDAKEAIKKAPAKATFTMDVEGAPQGIVALLGRIVDGKVEVVGQLPVAEDEVDATVAKFCDAEALPTDASADFLAKVIDLGQLVAQGGKTAKTTDGKKGGVALKAERALTAVAAEKGGLQLVVSARYASSSVIIKATPTAKQVKLGAVTTAVSLSPEQQAGLAKSIADREDRRLVAVAAKAKAKVLTWVTTDRALAAKSRADAVQDYSFSSVASQAEKPLDVDGFKPQVSVTVSAMDLRELDEKRLTNWRKDKAADKTKRNMKLTFTEGQLTYDIEKDEPLSVPTKGSMSGVYALNFRPRDICDVVEKLLATGAQSFDVQADASGMLRFGWSDKLGSYDVYLPTITAENTLNPKRIEQMRCVEAEAEAA
jgi:hypothetical protein